ncbi:MAG TPA: hypothetical protein ENK32_12395, partial [Anaerolineae bacterium]|nr:hypothetical protein [Anaerolineae bacterium]
AGTVLVYVPLTLLYEQAGNVPVAFAGRLYLQPDQADFGAPAQTRLVWLVMTRTDRCLPMPDNFDPDPNRADETEAEKVQAWCANPANWAENGPTAVHAYYDDWLLTGLTVQRNLGLKTAVVYEDPAYTAAQPGYDPNGFNDDNLWSLALGLDASFLAGRKDNSGARSLTIDDVVARWDKNSNAAATAEERWQLPQDAFYVERFDYPDPGGIGDLAQARAYQILENRFTSQAMSGGIQDPTLLFLQETRLRTLSLDYTDLITATANSAVLNVANSQQMPELVIAGMNWVPYTFNGSWQPYDMTQYWIDKGQDMNAALALTPGWTADDVTGASFVARAWYVSLAAGRSSVVEIDGLAAYLPAALADADMQSLLVDENPLIGTGKAVKNIVSQSIRVLTSLIGKEFIAGGGVQGVFAPPTLARDTQRTLLKNKRGAINLGKGKITPAKLAKAYEVDADLLGAESMAILKKQARWSDGLGYASTLLSAAAAITGFIAAGVAFTDANAAKTIGIVASSITIVATGLQIASLALKLKVTVALENLSSFGKIFSHFNKTAGISKGSIIFFIIGTVISLSLLIFTVVASGIQFGSLAFDQMLANFIAGVIVGVILLVIGSIPVIGQLVAAIVAIIDAIVAVICSLVPKENDTQAGATARNYLCGGISGLLTKLVSWFIYDQTPLVKMDRADRLNLTNFDFAPVTPGSGYSDGNQLRVSGDVQSALYRNDIDDITDISPFIVYRFQFNDANVKATTLAYTMTTAVANIHDPLTTGSMSGEWQPPASGGFAPDSNFVVTRPVSATVPLQTGVNRGQSLWLLEGQAYYVQECVMIPTFPPTPVCWLRDKKETQNLNLSEMMVFDVFPATLDEFMAQRLLANDAYALAWDNAFPALQDADGDGLISAAFGGPDPADNTPDTDGDGLSDFYELQQSATDPRLPDSDGDGLCDGQEVAFGTDPARADTDSDGLPDGDEVFHQDVCDGDNDSNTTEWVGGWEFVYAFDGALPRRTRVVPSPFAANPDGDAYSDSLEKVYGFNPLVPSSGGILNLHSEVGATIARPGTTISYTAELENALRANHALGLLDVQFNAAVAAGAVPPLAFNLQPQTAISTSGQITIDPALTQSQEVTMTNRAGALIVDPLEAVDGRSLWLRFNDTPAGDPLIFAEDSLNNWEVSCPAADCPVAGVSGRKNNGARFEQNDYLQMPDGLQAIGLTPNGFTVDLWLNPVLTNTFNLLESGGIRWDVNGGRLTLQAGGNTVADTGVPVVTGGRWNHLAWRYDGFTQTSAFFVDGAAVLTQPYDLTTALENDAASTIYIRGVGSVSTSAVLDDYAIYPFPLADSAIAALGRDRVFYLRGETNFNSAVPITVPVTIQDDSAYQNAVTCEGDAYLTGAGCPNQIEANVDNGYFWNNGGATNRIPVWVEPSPNLDLSGNDGAFTIAAWVNYFNGGAGGGSGSVMGYGDNSNSDYLYPTLILDADNGVGDGSTNLRITAAIENEAGEWCRALGFQNAFLQNWYHVSAVYEKPYFTFYVNGRPVDPTAVTYTTQSQPGGTAADCGAITPRAGSQFYVGGFGARQIDPFTGAPFFQGLPFSGGIDELQIFNYALSGEEIADIYWDEQPILDLRLDEPPASDLFADRAFSGFDGTCALAADTCPFSGLPGRDNQAAQFDGVNDFLAIADADQLQMVNSSFTLAGWVNPAGAGVNPVIGSDTANTLFFGLDSGGAPRLTLNGTTISGGGPVPAGAWTHLAARYAYDAAAGNGAVTLFVDGAAVITQTLVAPLAANANLFVGRETSSYFNGYLDRVAVYRQALSDADAAALIEQAPRVNLHLDDPFGAAGFANSGDPALTAGCAGASCPQADIKGRVYGGAALDGEDDLITIPENGNLLDFDRYSVGLWLMPTQQKNGRQSLISKGGGANTAFDLYILPDSMRVGFTAGVAGCAAQLTGSSVGALTENMWNQVMLVYDDAAGEARLYLNGSLEATTAVTATATTACQNNDPVQLGGNGVDLPFAGGMDEAVLYPDTLSDRDVAELFSYQLAWFDTRVGHQILIDADQPAVTLNVTAPWLPNRDKVLAVSASDPTSDIVSVEYNVNGGGWQAATPDVKAWLFTFTPAGGGSYTIELRATDEAGNVGGAAYTINVDGEGPVLGPLNVEGVSAAPAPWDEAQDAWAVALSGPVTAVGSPLDSVTVDVFNDLGASVGGVLTATVNSGVWQAAYPFTVQPNGVYTVTVRATDQAGNVATRAAPANVDGTPPDAAIADPGNGRFLINSAVTLSGLVTETGQIASGVQGVEIAFHKLGQNDASAAPGLGDAVLYLPLDETNDPATGQSVTRFANQAGLAYSQYEAVCANCPAAGSQGWLGHAVSFDGVNDELLVNGLGTAVTGGAVSLSAWVYPEAAAGQGAFLTLGGRQLLYDAGA